MARDTQGSPHFLTYLRFPVRTLSSRGPLEGLTVEVAVSSYGFQTWSNQSSEACSSRLCQGTGKGRAFQARLVTVTS